MVSVSVFRFLRARHCLRANHFSIVKDYLPMGLRKSLRRLFLASAKQRAEDIRTASNFLDTAPAGRLLAYHDLKTGAVVFDVGGYKGDWAANLLARHQVTLHIFEPVPAFAAHLSTRFGEISNVHVHTFGLSDTDTAIEIGLSEDATSAYRPAQATQIVEMRSMISFMDQHGISQIDLLAINSEGAEFPLLEHMIESNAISTCHRILVQFHRVVKDAEVRRVAIQAALSETHDCIYDFPFCWELWCLKQGTT